MKKYILFLLIAMASYPTLSMEQPVELLQSEEYFERAKELQKFRKSRTVDMAKINEMLKDKDTILLDTRGDEDYKRLHIRGAKHLSYADMTTDRLAKLIPDKNTRIILYCYAAIMPLRTRNLPLSTNAFVDMHMYGYTNLYEIRNINTIKSTQQLCKEILDMPFEGDATVIASMKKEAMQCLSSMR